MAKHFLLALSVLAFSSYGCARPTKEPSIKGNVAANTIHGSTHKSVAPVKEDDKWKALKDRNGRARHFILVRSLTSKSM